LDQLQHWPKKSQEMIKVLAVNGGHLGPTLCRGIDTRVALCFQHAKDKLIWDVSHQSYVHKLLTGRKSRFSRSAARGLSGFSMRSEANTMLRRRARRDRPVRPLGICAAPISVGAMSTSWPLSAMRLLTNGISFEASTHLSYDAPLHRRPQ